MAFDIQALTDAARCAECLSPNQKQNVLLYLLNGILENGTGGGGGGGVDCLHNLLSVIHPDTLPAAVSRGSLIVGNATPLWAELTIGAAGAVLTSDGTDASWATPASAGTVTSFSAGNLAPLFTTSVATASTTPALTFSLSTQAANLVFAGPASGAAAGPTFRSLVALDLPATAVVPAIYGSATQVGQFTVDQQGRITLAANVAITYPGSFSGFAAPSALVGLSAIAGVATTAMRSDGAPALDQAIVPTWTGTHTFTASATIIGSAANALNVIQIVPPAALGANMVDLFSDGGPGYNSIRKYFSSPFQVEIASSGGIDFVIDSNNNETGQSVKFLTNALRGGVQTTLFTFLDSGVLVFSPVVAGAIQFNPFGAAAGNTSEMRYLELLANGTNYTGFKAPDALAASEIYVFPDAAPAANRFLRAAAVAGGVSALSWAQVSLTADVTGILPVANGGSGTSTAFTAGSVIFAGAVGVYAEDNANLFYNDSANRLIVNQLSVAMATSTTVGGIYFGTARYFHNYGTANIFLGQIAGNFTMTGVSNVTLGQSSLSANTTGNQNLAIGHTSLQNNTTGSNNVGIGVSTLFTNTTGSNNVALGTSALITNSTGGSNVAIGLNALLASTIGDFNVAIGSTALLASTTAVSNVVIGAVAFVTLTTGSRNTGIGTLSGRFVTTGANNVLLGYQAGDALTSGANNIVLGYDIDTPTTTSSNTLTIGNLIFGTAIDGTGVTLSSGNIGIGVITPLAKFHVTNSAAATVAEIIKAAAAQSANLTEWQNSSATILTKVNEVGNVGVRMGATALTAYLHLAAGTTAASTAPIKFTTGTSMTAAEAGAVEFNTDDLFFTITTGAARKRLLMADATAGLTATRVPFATTNGRLTDDAGMTFAAATLTVPALTIGAAGVLQVGNAAAIGAALVSTHSITIKDSTGTTYRVPILV